MLRETAKSSLEALYRAHTPSENIQRRHDLAMRSASRRQLAAMDAGPEQNSSAEMSSSQPPLDTERILATDQKPLEQGNAVVPTT